MWKNNRPENWDEIKPHSTLKPDDPELKGDRALAYNCGYEWGVEAGADAILEAQIKGGIRFEPGMYAGGEEALFIRVLQMRGIRAGWLVFIEESK